MEDGKKTADTIILTAYEDHSSFDPTEPEKRLLRAVLLAALADLEKGGVASEEARRYFLDESEDYLFSFRSVCNFLGMDPGKFLAKIGLEARK